MKYSRAQLASDASWAADRITGWLVKLNYSPVEVIAWCYFTYIMTRNWHWWWTGIIAIAIGTEASAITRHLRARHRKPKADGAMRRWPAGVDPGVLDTMDDHELAKLAEATVLDAEAGADPAWCHATLTSIESILAARELARHPA